MLALPLPFELESVNIYLVALEDGYLNAGPPQPLR